MNHRIKTLVFTLAFSTLPLPALAADTATPAVSLEKPALVIPQTPAAPAVKSVKIGYIDITKIGMESEYGKSVKEGLMKKKKELEEKVIAKRKQLEKQKQSIEPKLAGMTPKQREAESKKFQKKVEDFQKLAQSSEEEFMKLQESETSSVYNTIEKTVSDFGKTSDLSLIMVKKDLLYIGSGVEPQDLTDTILKKVDEGRKK